ncbi:MAG: sulfatase [Saprospiraceae bacterium]|nr:sulfatase [Saprospiraceae bacterium]
MKKTILFFPLLLILTSCKPTTINDDRPNIVFILSDDHTSQAWGIYDSIYRDFAKNDNIKRLAAEGAVLDNAFCTNSICVPSRASILTGQYSHRNGIYTLSEGLNPDSLHIGKLLQTAGYETAIIGKWHLKQQPSGFDHFLVLPGQGRYDDPILKTAADWEDKNQGGKVYPGYSADVIGDHSVQWLQERTGEQPFMLMMHFKATHGPFEYPERHATLYQDIDLPEPASLYNFSKAGNNRTFPGQFLEELGRRMVYGTANPQSYWGSAPGLPFSTEGLDSIAARKKIYQLFAKNLLRTGAAIDDNIGKVLDYLDEAGLAENTVVIYTSDQGYFMGEHGFFDKRLMYEESLRMPFVIRYPKEIPAGQRLADIILNVDFPLLFADYANLPPPNSMQGRSFRANLQGHTPTDWRQQMYYRYWLHEQIRPAHFGIRNQRYKLIFYYGQGLDKPAASTTPTLPTWEFFDLQNDPQEMHNAYEDSTYHQVIVDMKGQLKQLRQELGDTDLDSEAMQTILSEHLPQQ